MGAKPFRVGPSPSHPGNGTQSAEETAFQVPGKLIRTAKDQGTPIPTQQDNTVESHGHGHSPRIPWPKDHPVDHKPFKVKE